MSKQLKQQHEQLLAKIPDNNAEWVAQQLLQMPPKERNIVLHALRKLDKVLSGTWAKDMPYSEIMQAVILISKEKYVNPLAVSPANYTMEPNTKQPDELKKDAEQGNAQESAAQDQAMEAAQDSEEGSTEG